MTRHDTRSPEEIESEIEQTRARLDDTVTAIQDKFSTGQLVDQAIGYFRRARHGGPAEFASNLGDTAKQNPVPVTLVGLGLSWLMVSGSNRSSGKASLPMRSSDSPPPVTSGDTVGVSKTESAKSTAASAKNRAKHMAGSSRDRAGNMAHGARERMSRMRHGTQSSMSSMSHQTGRAGRQAAHFMQEQPLVVGALGIAFGATLGAMLAPTRMEDEVMGEARDEALEAAAEAGERQFGKAESAARSAGEAAREEASGGTGGSTDRPPERETTASQGVEGHYGESAEDPGRPDHQSARPT